MIDQQQFHQFDNLELLAKQVVEGFIIGLHKSPYHGFSVEFAEHRLYNQGESVKNIDWKVFARTDKMYVKKYEEETNLRCQIVLDISSSMYFPLEREKNKYNKLEFAATSASALMYLLRKQRDAVGLTLFNDIIKVHTRSRSTSMHHKLLQNHLYEVIKGQELNKSTAAAKCLHQVAESLHKRSMVVIFSDMMENVEAHDRIFSGLQHLKHNKHEIIVFHVVDKQKELEFEFENRPHKFIDLESGEEIKLQSNQVKQYYVEKMNQIKNDLKLKCAQYKIDLVEADINEPFEQVLLPYLVKRSRMY